MGRFVNLGNNAFQTALTIYSHKFIICNVFNEIDVAKCFGMFFIYLGHYGVVTGNAYNWVFSFHVCLFFICLDALKILIIKQY